MASVKEESPPPPTTKVCSRCHGEFPLADFLSLIGQRETHMCGGCRKVHRENDKKYKANKREERRKKEEEAEEMRKQLSELAAARARLSSESESSTSSSEEGAAESVAEDAAESSQLVVPVVPVVSVVPDLPYRRCRLCGVARAKNRGELFFNTLWVCEYCKGNDMQWCPECDQEKPRMQFMAPDANFYTNCNQCRTSGAGDSAVVEVGEHEEGPAITVSTPRAVKRPRLSLTLRPPQGTDKDQWETKAI